MSICICGENKDVCVTCLKNALEWAAFKLVETRQRFGNAGFTTDDLDKLMNILGTKKFMEASEPVRSGPGVWGE